MNSLTNNVLLYARHVYGIQILYRNRVIYIKTDEDIYRIDPDLTPKGIYRFCSMNHPLVLTESNFIRGVFRIAAHKTYKEIRKIPTNEDWKKFINDAFVFISKTN